MEVRNRFQALIEKGESIIKRYGNFAKANDGAAEECVDKVSKRGEEGEGRSGPANH